jgi:molybdopterin molybdotransferase
LAENDLRQDYLRATIIGLEEGLPVATAFTRQDSSMLGILAKAQGLIVRPPHAPALKAGQPCRYIPL